MDESEADEFVEAMRAESPDILDLTDAYIFAMMSVKQFDGPMWFGGIRDGTFFMDSESVLWYPNTPPNVAASLMEFEIEESLTDKLEYL